MQADQILRKAADLIEERGKQRDQANGERSMAKTVAAFNAIYGTQLSEVQGWHFMELLKMVRSAYGQYTADDFDDKVSYAALAAEAAHPKYQTTATGIMLMQQQTRNAAVRAEVDKTVRDIQHFYDKADRKFSEMQPSKRYEGVGEMSGKPVDSEGGVE